MLKNVLKQNKNNSLDSVLKNFNFTSKRQEFEKFSQDLILKINKITQSEHIIMSKLSSEIYKEKGLDNSTTTFIIHTQFNSKFNDKVILINNSNKSDKIPFDPFAPPIPPELLIEDNFNSNHRLIANLYPLVKSHILITTREFISQYTHLREEDLSSMMLLISIINGIGIFNGGMNAGASQPHKHMQVFPIEELLNRFEIFNLINNESNNIQKILKSEKTEKDNLLFSEFSEHFELLFIKNYNFKHIVIKFSEDLFKCLNNVNFDNVKEMSPILMNIYETGLKHLKLETEDGSIKTDYSFLLTKEWMMIVPRKTFKIMINDEMLSQNSLVYTLSLIVKSEEMKESIKKIGLFKIINQFGYKIDEEYKEMENISKTKF